ncbi:MAG: nuclear transport factor 2 family protein [Acidimicrobiaceae bacterium]|uniref:limonene-1,2-epoxide hydrolase family protein n=1 Tax=Candidatus Poriferisodalis multihospitum TaxID=2983191 RepID=UPI00137E50DB|nr:limonene-1,2-epoxide hydrolase family protein [Candidatus Poriferisodalis multihospitum]MCY3584124.1 nuclear transport factor 2 family protein [Acidimicrobiaceae bacterium]MXX43044.1 limonene-1,2-epoxide hydrolase [Acidimicrobiales bacterium]MCY3608508.1 nuclear transport factor 2 family protein [Acidimicrobiaceae bacterium]MCY3892918.1 nuclear transport factor 2 family protein [Acidimicrobiaceae bacterium]MCY3949239.1 nuclear transport factor 2 family protein [Acidimicrobiaceae bacterium]
MTDSTASADSPTEVVGKFIACIEAKDLDGAAAHVSDDVYYDNVPVGDMTGPDAMKEFLSGLTKGDGPVEFEVVRQTATGNTVMNERVDRFHTGSGRLIELPVMGIFEVNDGLITFWRDYFDNGMFMRQIKG